MRRAGFPVPADAGEAPTLLDAVSAREYAVPSVRPLIVALVADAAAVSVIVVVPAAAVSVYPVTGFPPSSPGGVQDTTSAPGRANTAVISGASGTCAASGTIGLDGAEAALDPAAFAADAVAW